LATTYKILGQVAPAANVSGGSQLYAVSSTAGSAAVVSTIVVCNRGTSAATYRIAIREDNAALDNKQYLAYDAAIPANTTTTFTLGVTLSASDTITVVASTANLTFQAFGSEVA
jgi:hypothetical protein